MDKLVVFSDLQARFVDWRSLRAVLDFVKDVEPQTVVINGDLVDFEALSKFPTAAARKTSMMKDIKAGKKVLEMTREAAPNARIVLTAGNHEERLEKYITVQAPELAGVPGLNVPTLLQVEKYNVEYVGPWGAGIDWHTLHIYHGSFVRSASGATAKAELESRWTSGISGHTQRVAEYCFTDGMGVPHTWYECGCLCRLDPAGAPPSQRKARFNNWQNGLVYCEWDDGAWSGYAIVIHRHKFIWGGKVYGG